MVVSLLNRPIDRLVKSVAMLKVFIILYLQQEQSLILADRMQKLLNLMKKVA